MTRTIIISFVIASLCVLQIKAQKIDTLKHSSPQALHDMYMKKSTRKKTAGWVLLGSGATMTLGALVFGNVISFDDDPETGLPFFYLGIASGLTSFPFFISAAHNKKKAKLALKRESVTGGNKLIYRSGYTAFALTIPLGNH